MVIGGYVAFMNKIQATNMLVYLAIKPLAFLKKSPYLAAALAIPIGQLLFITTPSAAGVGLLLQQHGNVMAKAIRICLECVGIG